MALIHLDAGVVIGFLDADEAHHERARAVLAAAVAAGESIEMAASALSECLVAPARRGERAVSIVLDLVRRLPIHVVSLDLSVAAEAARLRARHASLRLPDALVIATAASHGADRLVTTDARWPSARRLGVPFAVERL